MRNKKILFSLFLLIFVFTACSSDSVSDSGTVVDSEGTVLENFGQPEREAEINGVIKSISGNLMTVAIVEKQAGDNTEEETTGDTAAAVGVTTTNIPGSGGGGGGGGTGSGDSSVSDADRLEKLLERSTGQETLTVPVGIAMTKFSEGEEREKVEAILSDLKSGSMVSVWLNPDVADRKVAEFVSIR